MARQTKQEKETVARVMHEFKHGDLDSAQGGKVRNPKQAIAIALHEAGASNRESPTATSATWPRQRKRSGPGRPTKPRAHEQG